MRKLLPLLGFVLLLGGLTACQTQKPRVTPLDAGRMVVFMIVTDDNMTISTITQVARIMERAEIPWEYEDAAAIGLNSFLVPKEQCNRAVQLVKSDPALDALITRYNVLTEN